LACTTPIRGVRGSDGVVRLKKGIPDSRLFGGGTRPELELPCGRCMDCKVRRTQDWVTRVTHETTLHDDACFLTLTFSDDGLALRELQHGTHRYDLDMGDWQRFAKRLRKELKKRGRPGIRYFQVGEYGDEEKRPHYHALIFGEAFRGDGEKWKDENGHPAWLSTIIEKCWPYGFHEIKEATPESIAYVCKYVQKKLYGEKKERQQKRIDCETGEEITVRPELASMSRGGRTGKGIGHGWWKEFGNEVFPDDFVILKGKKVPVPRYYFKQLEAEAPDLYELVSEQRCKSAAGRAADNTPERRLVRGKVTAGKLGIAGKRKL